MPIERTTTVYKFEELSEEAKQRARDINRDINIDYEWWQNVYEQADTAAQALGITMNRKVRGALPAIQFSGFCSQGDGACFEGTYAYAKGWRSKLVHMFGPGETLEELLKVGQTLQATQARQFYKLEAVCSHRGHYSHSGCMSVQVYHVDDMYRDIGDAEDDIAQALRDFADWVYGALESEHDYLSSDEQVETSITAGGYEFLVNGEAA